MNRLKRRNEARMQFIKVAAPLIVLMAIFEIIK